MKLVDILARELKEWPDGQKIAEQSKVDNEIYFEPQAFGDFYAPERADDYMDALVTRSQWQEARDALLKADAKEWSGEGLPPVGVRCERSINPSTWKLTRICGHSADGAYAAFYDGDGLMGWGDDCKFRPIRTPEQIAAEDRSVAISDIINTIGWLNTQPGCHEAAGRLYDAGYRKQEPK